MLISKNTPFIKLAVLSLKKYIIDSNEQDELNDDNLSIDNKELFDELNYLFLHSSDFCIRVFIFVKF